MVEADGCPLIWVRDVGQSYADHECVFRVSKRGPDGTEDQLDRDPTGDYEVVSCSPDPTMQPGRWLKMQPRRVQS